MNNSEFIIIKILFNIKQFIYNKNLNTYILSNTLINEQQVRVLFRIYFTTLRILIIVYYCDYSNKLVLLNIGI